MHRKRRWVEYYVCKTHSLSVHSLVCANCPSHPHYLRESLPMYSKLGFIYSSRAYVIDNVQVMHRHTWRLQHADSATGILRTLYSGN